MNNIYDKIRWFVYAQDQMTKKQLISFAESIFLEGRVNYSETKENLKDEINSEISQLHKYRWDEVKRITEIMWKEGGLNYDANWSGEEPDWENYNSTNHGKITGSIDIEDNDFYMRLIKYSVSDDGSPSKPEKILAKIPSNNLWNKPLYESEDKYVESPRHLIYYILGTASFVLVYFGWLIFT
jgi:hypothetical protein